jgi:1-acyl-sn-glycerol-3-phosphate acyltransferase
MRVARYAWEYLVLAIGAALLASICAIWGTLSLLLHVLLPAAAGRRVGRAGAMWGFRIYLAIMELLGAWRLDLAALDELRAAGPLIIAPNHPCLLDAVLVVSRLPNALCVMKGALVRNFLLGPAARLARYVPNDSLPRLLTRAGEELAQGGQLLLFPEGTRTPAGAIGKLTQAVGALSRSSQVPVQAVFIETDSAFLGKGRSLLTRPRLPLAYRVRLGRRFDPPKDVRAFTRDLERYFAHELAGPLEAMDADRGQGVRDAADIRG